MGEARLAERYEPLEVVGRGGEASVLKAIDTRHERLVALKVRIVPPDGSAERPLVETRALLSLPPHPGLAHARDDFFDGDRYVLVLDWVDGVNLARLLVDEGRPGLPVSSVLHWVAQAAEALSALHQHGVVHGDVKPANLILDRTGRIVLVDLGSSSAPMTAAAGGGTSGFRAPEVAAGAPAVRASDVFSLAATAFTLLTGTAPTGARPAWTGLPADVAARFEAALRAGLAIDPARRPATPGELVERLRAGWDDQTPTGVSTVLLTDVVESTRLWELSPQRVPALLAEMQLAVDRSVEAHGGRRLGATVEGDATSSVFANALSALQAAIALQRDLTSRPGALCVRAGLATGELVPVDSDVLGPTVGRAARVRDLARPGEIVVSASTADLVRTALPEGAQLMALGPHVLRGLDGTDEVAAVVADGVSAPPDPARSPYPGLASFGRDEADLFFGREEIVERCLELFAAERFVAVVGASGSGKSSLVLAGIAPRLADVVVVRPGAHPEQTLQRAGIPGHDSAVLIVDQLEELVTMCHDTVERATFIDAVVAHPGGLVVAVRADLYGELGAFAELADRLASSQVLLGPLSEPDLVRAVQEPARRCGLAVEEGLAELIAAELGEAPGALPLLGHALREAWLRRDGRTITVAGYRASGGVRSAIATTAEQALAALDRQGQVVARRVLLRMVELRPEGEDTRRWASRREITDVDPQRTEDVVAALTESRLLVIDHDQITVAHEALLRAWPRLNGWIVEARADLLALQELRGATERWTAGGRSDTDLYRGPRLDGALALAEHERLNTDEAAFVEAGRKLRQHEHEDARRRTRRLRGLAAVTSITAVIALVGGGIAVVQRNDAQRSRDQAQQSRDQAQQAQTEANAAARSARIEALVGRADSLRNSQRDTAALLAVEAFRLADTARSRSALLATFTDAPGLLESRRVNGVNFGTAIVLPGSDAAYVNMDDARFRSYDLDTGALGEEFPTLGRPWGPDGAAAVSPDGDLLAQALSVQDGVASTTVGIFETANRAPRFPPVRVDGIVSGVAFIRSASALALAVGPEGRLVILDATSGKEMATVPGAVLADGQEFRSSVAVVDGHLVVGSADGSLRILDSDTLELQRTIPLRPGTVSQLRAVGDGTMVTIGRAGLARVDVTDGTVDWQHESDACEHLAVFADRGTFYCGDAFGGLVERDLRTGVARRRLDVQNGNTGELWPARGGTELVSFSIGEPVVTRWRLDGSGAITHVVAPGFSPVSFDPAGARLIVERASSAVNHESRVVDVGTGKVDLDLDGMVVPTWVDGNTIAGAVASDGKVQGAHAHVDQGTVVPDGVAVDRVPVRAEHDTGKERAVLFFDDSAGTEVTSIDLTTNGFGPTIPVDRFLSMAISRTGDRIVVSSSAGVHLYDGTTGERLGTIEGAFGSAFITDADQLFIGARGGALTQYDIETLEPIRTFGGSRGFIYGVGGTVDGTIIATISGDRNVRLYDVATGTTLGTPITIANDESNIMTLSLDGKQLAVGGEPATGQHAIQIWDLEPDHWVAAACRLAGRNLTHAEWDTNIGDLAPYRATCPAFPANG
jgi:class 3 adenylate cyclase/WD40 repeat protein